jgi:hypothetical protein
MFLKPRFRVRLVIAIPSFAMDLVLFHPIHLLVESHMSIAENDVASLIVTVGYPIVPFYGVAGDVTILRTRFHYIRNGNHVAGH